MAAPLLPEEDSRSGVIEVLRTLVDEVRLVPEDKALAIILRGDLAAMLSFADGKTKHGLFSEAGLLTRSIHPIAPVSMVAGTGFEPVTFRL
jgi:site-specific DNA recombinase